MRELALVGVMLLLLVALVPVAVVAGAALGFLAASGL
jgi:hypothetical protein